MNKHIKDFKVASILGAKIPAVTVTVQEKCRSNEMLLVYKDKAFISIDTENQRIVVYGEDADYFKANEDFELSFDDITNKVIGKAIIKTNPQIKEVWIANL